MPRDVNENGETGLAEYGLLTQPTTRARCPRPEWRTRHQRQPSYTTAVQRAAAQAPGLVLLDGGQQPVPLGKPFGLEERNLDALNANW